MKRILLFTVIFFVISAPAFLYSQLKLNVRASASNLLRYGRKKLYLLQQEKIISKNWVMLDYL